MDKSRVAHSDQTLEQELPQQLVERGIKEPVPHTTFPAHWLYEGEQRLDAGYYASEALTAKRIVQDTGFTVRELGQLVQRVFILGRFRRIYGTNKKASWPYLSASESLVFRPVTERWIAKDYAPREALQHFVEQGWILVSCSGTVGRVVLATRRLEKYFLTHDLVRVVPKKSPPVGYLYAFLASQIGQALLSKDQYGGAIKHLEPHHIARVPVPLVPEVEQKDIHRKILKAYALRDKANKLLDEADEMLHDKLGLPRFDESLVPYLPSPPRQPGLPKLPHPGAFTLQASELGERLDASYHVPVVKTVISLLHKGTYPLVQLGNLAESIFIPPRFKRIYVPEEYGIPFIRPSHLPQIRPFELNSISKLTDVLDLLLLKKGDVLITTDGTVGRIALVSTPLAGWAGSNNIARVTYGNRDNRNGYLAAFLSSPYGFYQLNREIYGGVVDHIEVPHISSVVIPDAPHDIQIAIGQRVVNAFEKKEEATRIEQAAIQRLESLLERAAARQLRPSEVSKSS